MHLNQSGKIIDGDSKSSNFWISRGSVGNPGKVSIITAFTFWIPIKFSLSTLMSVAWLEIFVGSDWIVSLMDSGSVGRLGSSSVSNLGNGSVGNLDNGSIGNLGNCSVGNLGNGSIGNLGNGSIGNLGSGSVGNLGSCSIFTPF